MKEGIQSAIDDVNIRKYGCFFLSILKLASEKFVGTDKEEEYSLSSEKMLKIVRDVALEGGYIRNDMTVLDPSAVYLLGGDLNPKYTKVFKRPSGNYITEWAGRNAAGVIFTHFTCNIDGKEWDPLDPARKHVEYSPVSYRVFEPMYGRRV